MSSWRDPFEIGMMILTVAIALALLTGIMAALPFVILSWQGML